MKPKNRAHWQWKQRRTQRGAALVFALVAVIVIATLTLATGRLIGGHLALEQEAEGYSHAIHIAEAAANWQLNHISRSKLPGDLTSIPGRLNYEEVNTWSEATNTPEPYIGTLPASELGTNFDGNVKVWVRSATRGGKWSPPEDLVLNALGQDAKTRIVRGVQFTARPVGLSEQYALFGINALRLDSAPTDAGAESGAAQLLRGYIGSNGSVWSRDAAPMPTSSAEYFGCRLGPTATLSPTGASWPSGWDFPRLPDAVRMPTIDQIIGFMYRGRTVADCATANDNTQIYYQNDGGGFSLLRQGNGSAITRLTSTEFNISAVHRTILLRATETATNGNLFYFTQIQMRPGDTLILDSRQTFPDVTGPQHSLRILINNADPNSRTVVTNLAYFKSFLPLQTAGDIEPTQSYFWYNNTPGEFVYQPSSAANPDLYAPPNFGSSGAYWKYQLDPTLRGCVYSVNALSAPNNTAGDIKIFGKNAFAVTVRSLIGNHVSLLGPVQVQWDTAEDNQNPNMYVLYYSIRNRTYGEIRPDADPYDLLRNGDPAAPVYDYGK